jgi:hypothetical protein
MGANTTAAKLLEDLKAHGFRLAASDEGIRVAPAIRLTDAIRKSIWENEQELLPLLRDEAPAAKPRVKRRPQRKAARKPPAGSKDQPTPKALNAQVPIPESGQKPVSKPQPRAPYLCGYCQQFHYPTCPECRVRNDPGLKVRFGHVFRTRDSEPVGDEFPTWFRKLSVSTAVPGYHPCVQSSRPSKGSFSRLGNPLAYGAS